MHNFIKTRLEFKDKPILVLAGNANTGKSMVFNYLTKQYVSVSNYPGTTVDISRGIGSFAKEQFIVIDTPGTSSLLPQSEDEAVTRSLLVTEAPKVIIQVIDSKSLRRSLNLTQELADLGIPIVLCLNMSDEAKDRGIIIDRKKLEEALNIKAVETVATTRDGLPALRAAVLHAGENPFVSVYDIKIEQAIGSISFILGASVRHKRFISLSIICGEKEIYGLISIDKDKIHQIEEIVNNLQKEYPQPLKLVIKKIRESRSKEIAEKATTISGKISKNRIYDLLGKAALRPITAIPMAVLLLYVMYKFVGQFAAGFLVDFLESNIFGTYLIPWVESFLSYLKVPGWTHDFLMGDYGIISMAVTYALAIIFPIVGAFFLFFGLLEDSGYLPRLCVLLDRLFHPIGLNGKAVLPFILGLGCGTMATLTTRTLDTKKERVIATLILALAIPCSAQLGVIMGMLSDVSQRAFLIWFGIMVLSGFSVSFLVSKIIPGRRSVLIQEIPPIRMPQFRNILIKTWMRIKWYLKEAVPLFVLGAMLLFLLDKIGILDSVNRFAEPLVVKLLSLPHKATEAFLVGFFRRDYGAAGLYMLKKSGQLDGIQTLVSIVVITLFVPCIAQFFVMIKERGLKTALVLFLFTFIFAFIVGGALNFLLRFAAIAI
ncbi:MAG: ferrous iron transport protein B [Candidatus Omnitrophota bacterium]